MTMSSLTAGAEIRVVPMSMVEEFPDEKGLKEFFVKSLPNGNDAESPDFQADLPERQRGQYFYREAGLSAERGSLLLFQWNSMIVAQATLVTVKATFDDPTYRGSLYVAPSTIRLIQPFVTQAEFAKIWPGKHFSNAKHKLNVNGLTAWNKLIQGRI